MNKKQKIELDNLKKSLDNLKNEEGYKTDIKNYLKYLKER